MQKDDKLPFLEFMVERRNSELITYVYRKPIDMGVYLQWTSNQPRKHKISLIKCLCNRAKRICLLDTLFKQELVYYKNIFIANGYPLNIIKKTIRSTELNIIKNKPAQINQRIFVSVPYYGQCTLELVKKIGKSPMHLNYKSYSDLKRQLESLHYLVTHLEARKIVKE